jgi:hypothetical protein
MNEAGDTYDHPADLAQVLGIPALDFYTRIGTREASGHVERLPGSVPREYALTYLGIEVATTA